VRITGAEAMNGEELYMAYNSTMVRQLLNDTTLTSADFMATQMLQAGQVAQNWCGFTWIPYEQLDVGAGGGTDRRTVAWCKSGVQFGTGIWQGLSVDRFVSAYATTGQDISVATSARIRLIGTDVILASCPINLRAAVPAVPPPPPPAPPDPPTSLGLDAEYTQTASFDVPSTMSMWLRLFRNGTWSIVTPDTGTPTTGDWHSSPASDVGDSYQARVTVTAGSALVPTNQMNTWTLLNTTRSFIMEIIVPGTGTVEFTLEVRAVAGASIGSSDSLFTLTGTGGGGGGG
jgi:hypothetical protein